MRNSKRFRNSSNSSQTKRERTRLVPIMVRRCSQVWNCKRSFAIRYWSDWCCCSNRNWIASTSVRPSVRRIRILSNKRHRHTYYIDVHSFSKPFDPPCANTVQHARTVMKCWDGYKTVRRCHRRRRHIAPRIHNHANCCVHVAWQHISTDSTEWQYYSIEYRVRCQNPEPCANSFASMREHSIRQHCHCTDGARARVRCVLSRSFRL